MKSLKSDQELFVGPAGRTGGLGQDFDQRERARSGRAGRAHSVPLAQVTDIRNPAEQHNWERLEHPNLIQLWIGHFDMGLAIARGNARAATLTTGFDASRVTRHDKICAHFDQIYSTARLNGVRIRWPAPNTPTGPTAQPRPPPFRQHPERLRSRCLPGPGSALHGGGGLGDQRHQDRATSLGLLAGGDYEHEAFTNNVTRDSAEFNVGDDFQYKLSSASSITQSFRIFPNLTTTGDYRFGFDLSAVTALKKWLAWHVTFSDSF